MQEEMSGGLIQIPSQKPFLEWSTDTYSSLYVTISLDDFVGHPTFQLGSMPVTRILNQTTRGQTLWRSVHMGTDITTCSHQLLKLTVEPSSFFFATHMDSCYQLMSSDALVHL